ncbi:MAG: glycoside hydrolase family 57 protein [Patescibacteria group bacterium]|nr:glycoside hydrolase family 57 protein [Patescibacteria group bacterium]MDE1965875.1 glycoside hydrolase family 57 protein [Patescibacteria group bacterium]
MPSVCFYFQIHQPYRVKRYRVFDIGNDPEYFSDEGEDDLNNGRVLRKVADKSYRPALDLIRTLLERHPEFRASFSLSGVALEQLARHAPDVIERLRELAKTGRVEFLGETYHHSLSFFYSPAEFERQVRMHRALMRETLGVTPRVFRNTELSYTNALARWAEDAGYDGIIAEGWDPVLGWRSPNFVYRPKDAKRIRLLLKNYRLSDDIAFRFSSKSWSEWPLTAEKFASWVRALKGSGETVNLFMDFETFGEHQWEDTGIFAFLEQLPQELLRDADIGFKTPSEVIAAYPVRDEIDVPHVITWADTDRDLTAWTGNAMQQAALADVYALEAPVLASGDEALIERWRKLQTSDHFYYMCTKWFADGDVHAYFSPYESPYDAHIAYMNALADLRLRLPPPARAT